MIGLGPSKFDFSFFSLSIVIGKNNSSKLTIELATSSILL
jgi:hypothetical protein